MSRFIGIIGYPLRHSISPEFQQAALDHLKLDIRYERWETEGNNLAETVARLRQPEYIGANVTVPFKEMVLPKLDEIDASASFIKAVNTIVNRGGRLIGYNTDAPAFLRALKEDAFFWPSGKRVVLLGAGGAARAVSFALVCEGIKSLAIANRHRDRADGLVRQLQQISHREARSDIFSIPWDVEALTEYIHQTQLIVNCTTIGMLNGPEEELPLVPLSILPSALVYDMIYNPPETLLLRMAKKFGAQTLNGQSMLIYQGAASFELWTGVPAPLDVMKTAVNEALRSHPSGTDEPGGDNRAPLS